MRSVVQQNCTTEIVLHAPATYQDPYNDVDIDARLTGPDGASIDIPGFWAGDDVWKLRMSATTPGEYRWETRCSNADDAGLHGQSGTLVVEAYRGNCELLKHGRLRVAEDRRHFEHTDGTPFFWRGDTWWMGLTTRLDWPHGFRELATDRVVKGFNVVQIIAGPFPDMEAWDPRGRNEAGFPFEAGFERVNTAYYDHADLKIAELVRVGLMPCIVGMWGYYMPQLGVDKAKRFWRYLVARYGAYPVVWCICGEGAMPYYLSETKEEDAAAQKKGWSDVMRYVRSIDGYSNLITIHPTQYGREQVEDPSLMDFEMLQTGHGDLDSVPATAQSVATAVAREPVMPVINSEVNYEGILGRCWQNIQRLCFYHSALNGTAGHTYGANGIWQMSTADAPYGPSPHGACWGNTPWREAMHLPGAAQVALGGRFMARFPWWTFEQDAEWHGKPDDTNTAYQLQAVSLPDGTRIIYVPICWDPPAIPNIAKDHKHRAYYFDPCTGEETDLGFIEGDENNQWTPPKPPVVHDWLLVVTPE